MNKKLYSGIIIGVIVIVLMLTGWYFLEVSKKAQVTDLNSTPAVLDIQAGTENKKVQELQSKPENITWVTDWDIKEGEKMVDLVHKECGFGLAIPKKWKIDQKDNLYLGKEKGYAVISNEFKAAPYLSFTIICGDNIVLNNDKVLYNIPRPESKEPIVADRRLSGDNVTKIQHLLFTHNDKKYSMEIRVNYSYGSLVGDMFTTKDKYETYWKEEQQGIDAILKTFYFLDEK
jgi:hypothetical protein